jgi:hypothetical protein
MQSRFVRFAALFAVPAFAVGCIIEDDPPRRVGGPPTSSTATPAPTTGSGTGTTPTPPPGTPGPMLVEVDTGQTLTANPGEGVGVFVEYAAGGKWHLWWTCDTQKTQQSCDFSVSATAAQGNITNVDAQQLAGGYVASPTASRVEAHSSTSNEVNGINFTTNAGETITVEASIGGVEDGSFLFFVQDGKVNGGYTGKLTDPLQLVGKTP